MMGVVVSTFQRCIMSRVVRGGGNEIIAGAGVTDKIIPRNKIALRIDDHRNFRN